MKRSIVASMGVVLLTLFSCLFIRNVSAASYYDAFYKESSWNGLSLKDNLGGSEDCDSNITYLGGRKIGTEKLKASDLFTCAWLRSDKGDRGHYDTEGTKDQELVM